MAAGAVVKVAVVVVAGIEQEGNPFPDSRHRGMLKAAIQKVLFIIATKKSHPEFRVGFFVFPLSRISCLTSR